MALKNEMKNLLDEKNKEMERNKNEYDDQINEKIFFIDELNKKINEIEQMLGLEVGGKDTELLLLKNDLSAKNSEIKVLKSSNEEKEEEIFRLKNLLLEKNIAIANNSGIINNLTIEIEKLKNENLKLNQRGGQFFFC